MNPFVITSPIEVGNRLSTHFGFKAEDMREVVDSMVAARNSCTENNPPGAPGWLSWNEGSRRLREIGTLQGWERDDTAQICSIYDRKRGIKIAVCNTDDGTGLLERIPQNRNKKGAATDRAIQSSQGTFNGILEEAVNNVIQLSENKDGVTYWYLCVFSEGETVRAELSCPSICEGGFFTDFSERIFLTDTEGGDGGARVTRRDSESGPNLDINVTRKQA